jgi:glutathione synthase/RimK-type ligase-like ATP-grasp enzyme
MFIYGYNFPNNNSAAAKICDDKSGLSKILQYKNVPTFKYDFFMRGFYSNEEVEASFKRNGGDVVVKPNNGTGGNNVYRCKTLSELNSNIDLIISQHQSFVISKFYEYENEYRVIICNNKNMTIYKKQRQND